MSATIIEILVHLVSMELIAYVRYSYFGKQDGDFNLELKAITARKQTSEDQQRTTSKLV